MRLTLAICMIFAVLWSGYWSVGWFGLDRGIAGWAEDRRAEGWQVDWSEARVRGFPSRFDTTLTDPVLADPHTGWAWQGPFFQLFALSYRPNHLIAVWPDRHLLSTPLARYRIAHDRMRASLVFAGTDFRVARTTFVIDALDIETAGWDLRADKVRFATRPAGDTATDHEIGLDVAGLRPARGLKTWLDPAGVLPETVETLHLDAVLGFDAPWNRFALEHRRPQPVSLVIRDTRATWGGLDLRIAADLALDEFGLATGKIGLKAANWREILALFERAGILGAEFRPVLEGMLDRLTGSADALDLPIRVTGGRMSVGAFPIGQMAPLRIR